MDVYDLSKAVGNLEQRIERHDILIKQLGARYEKCDMENYEVYEEAVPKEELPRDPTQRPRDSQRQAYQRMRRFVAEMQQRTEKGAGLILFGKAGTGKDHWMVAALRVAVLVHGWSVKWFNGENLYDRFKATFDLPDKERANATESIEKICQVPRILAISDPSPSRGTMTEYSVKLLQKVVDARYRVRKPVWITMNVNTRAEAERVIADNTVDRLGQEAMAINCQWLSYRRRMEAKHARS